jgi:hypothetical protein
MIFLYTLNKVCDLLEFCFNLSADLPRSVQRTTGGVPIMNLVRFARIDMFEYWCDGPLWCDLIHVICLVEFQRKSMPFT